MNDWVQGFYTSIENFRELGHIADFQHRNASFAQGTRGAAG